VRIKELIHSPDFVDRHRTSATAFTRNRTLTFPALMLHCLNLIKGSLQQELYNTLRQVYTGVSHKQHVTKSAFTLARKKFSHSAFIELNQKLNDHFYSQGDFKTWHGFRPCAVDGSQLRLPNAPDVIKTFGLRNGRLSQRDVPMALASLYDDVLNQRVIDAGLYPTNTPERECAQRHLQQAKTHDLVLLDRGYPAFWLYTLLEQHNLHYCMRAKTRLDENIKRFMRSRKSQAIIELSPHKIAERQCEEKHLPTAPIRVRLIRVKLKSETEVLITNLLDDELYPVALFKDLYHQRWLIEEQYKRQKQWLEIENFSGKSVESIYQDFYAKQVTHNLTAMMTSVSQKRIDQTMASRKCYYKINFAQALSSMKDNVIALLLNHDLTQRILNLLERFTHSIEAVRPGRRFKRRMSNLHHNLYHIAYKACR
jgi:hypothetical protein